jgi:hypothetical protein
MEPNYHILFYYINPNKLHMLQGLFYLTTALHVSGVTITHLQEHKTTVTTASGNCYMLNIYYSIEHIAFSAEYTLSTTIVILILI